MRSTTLPAALLLALAALAIPACDEEKKPSGLTLKQVVELLELGYSDSEVRSEIEKNGAGFPLDPASEKALRDAGAGDDLLAFLRGTKAAPEGADIAALLAGLKTGEPVGRTLDRIAATPRREPTPEERKAIEGAEVPLPVRLALLGEPLTLADLDALAAAKTEEPVYGKLLAICGATGEKIPAPRAIALLRAGAPKSALEEFRKGAGAKRAPAAGATADPAAATAGPAVAEAAGADGYLHLGRRFRIRCPGSWTVLRDLREGEVRYVFTPESGKERIDDVSVAIVLTLGAPPEGTVWADRTPRELLEHMLPWIRVAEPEMAPDGDLSEARLGALPAATATFEGVPRGRTGRFRSRVHLAEKDGLVYSVVTIAPAGEFAKWEEPMRRVLESSEFGRLGHATRRAEPIEASALADRYKRSVVMVHATTEGFGGFGSGFFISRDGYLLTNWHVVWNSRKDRLHDKVVLEWDDSLRMPPVEAKVIGTWHRYSGESLAGGMIGGVDIALLKVDPGEWEPVPLTPLSEVSLGDPVVAIGFPQTGRVAGLSLFVTRGVVVRFNRDATGACQSLTTDAKTTHGSSGGPCFDLRTGGVIGLNTWGYDIGSRDMTGEDARDLVGYHFVCPTDAALAHFPLVADLGLPHDPDLDFLSWYELAGQFLALAAREEALAAADRAVEREPQNADALVLRGTCQQALGMQKLADGEGEAALDMARQAEASFERATIADPKKPEPRVALAALLVSLGRADDAAKHADRAVADFPDRFDAHLIAARVAVERGKIEDAMREIDAAKRTSREMIPDPWVLAGQIAYTRGWYEEGRREFEAAVRIHPRNFEARLGVADYDRLKKRWDGAIAGYEKMKGDFPSSPYLEHRIAYCRRAKGDPEAFAAYVHADQAFEKNGLTPPESFYLEIADIGREREGNLLEIRYLAKYLARFETGPNGIDVHLRLAGVYRTAKLNGCSTLHVRRAVALAKAGGKEWKPEGFPEEDPGLADLNLVVEQAGYDIGFLANLIVGGRLAYAFPTEPPETAEKERRRLVEEAKLPPYLIDAIIESNRRYPPKAAGPGAPGAAGPPGTPVGPATPNGPKEGENPVAKQILGVWSHRSTDPILGEISLTMTFTADGQWSAKGVTGGFRVDDGGTYTVSGNTIRTIIQRSTNPVIRPGTPGTFQVDIKGNTLRLTGLAGGDWMEFSRQ